MTRTACLLPCLLLLAACRADSPAAPRRVESPGLAIAIAQLPAACDVLVNRGEQLVLGCRSQRGSEGRLSVEVAPPEAGVDLLDQAKAQKEAFEALPEGRFFGNRELVTPFGTAYTARGRYVEDGQPVEEARILALHPQGDRPITYRFRYPEGDDTQQRVDQLLLVVGEVEGTGGAVETN
ncbi:MAG TPA: hypothetical protein VMT16_00400 [Thermoanaerobaculia bacterium]|nr:hypothetical protein [Thermoanaerobaculia bacterium]